MNSSQKPYGTVLLKANTILQYILKSKEAPDLAQISSGLNLPKPTTLKILNTLELLNWVRRDDQTKTYYLGTQLVSYGDKALNSINLIQIAKPFLAKLRDETQETVNLGIERHNHIILIDKLESPRSIKLQSIIGGEMNLYSSSMGKAVLATFSPEKFKSYCHSTKFTPITPHTITSTSSLQSDINLIKQTGFSLDNEENEPDVFCIGATLRKNGRLYGAFSISTPTYRLDEKRKNDFIRLLLNTKEQIEKAI